jgi:hypothetical protein
MGEARLRAERDELVEPVEVRAATNHAAENAARHFQCVIVDQLGITRIGIAVPDPVAVPLPAICAVGLAVGDDDYPDDPPVPLGGIGILFVPDIFGDPGEIDAPDVAAARDPILVGAGFRSPQPGRVVRAGQVDGEQRCRNGQSPQQSSHCTFLRSTPWRLVKLGPVLRQASDLGQPAEKIGRNGEQKKCRD